MSQQDMDPLRDAIADELGLARDGIGYEEVGVADEIVAKYVAPLRAELDLLLWLHAEAVWEARVESGRADDWCAKWESAEASRRDWAAEVARVQEKVRQLLGLLACVYDSEPCWFDHHGGCQAHGYLDLQPGEICPQREIGGLLATAETDASGAPCSCLTPEGAAFVAAQPKWSLPLCAVHPEADR